MTKCIQLLSSSRLPRLRPKERSFSGGRSIWSWGGGEIGNDEETNPETWSETTSRSGKKIHLPLQIEKPYTTVLHYGNATINHLSNQIYICFFFFQITEAKWFEIFILLAITGTCVSLAVSIFLHPAYQHYHVIRVSNYLKLLIVFLASFLQAMSPLHCW